MTEKLTLNVAEAARLLGLSVNSTYAAVAAGQIPSVKIGNRILVPRVRLEAMLAGERPRLEVFDNGKSPTGKWANRDS